MSETGDCLMKLGISSSALQDSILTRPGLMKERIKGEH
jgi:hypothetical protein